MRAMVGGAVDRSAVHDRDGLIVSADALVKTCRQGARRVSILHDVSLTIGTGEFVAIMGPSGSGKSTLLHLLGGLAVPDGGSVRVAGQDLGRMTEDARTVFRRRHVGVVFQCFNLVPTLTVEENVALPLRLDGQPSAIVQARVAAALEQVGLLDRRRQPSPQLSGGEQQRVALARALAVEPVLILADEPTGSLDSATAAVVLRLFRTASDDGRTVVMVTHDAGAAAYADRIVRVVDGTVEPELDQRKGTARCVRAGS
jgi:putative ABC transport system ATP-binding protein